MADKLQPLIDKISKSINADPSIKDPSRLIFSEGKRGGLFSRERFIVVEGSVADIVEQEKVEKLLAENSNGVKIETNIEISPPFV